jgi:eukaryotic-like serine/threonine-protein kinase
MTVADMATTTLVKIKDYTSTTLVKATRGIARSEFMRRSRRAFLVCLVLGLAAHAAGYLVYRSRTDGASEAFVARGVTAARAIAQECRPFVLDKDVLMLNLSLGAAERIEGFQYAAALDHQSEVLTRTGPEPFGRALQALAPNAAVRTIDGVAVADLPTSPPTALFTHRLTYAEVDIGGIQLALSTAPLHAALAEARTTYLGAMAAITALLVLGLLLFDQREKKKARQLAERLADVETIGPYHLVSKVATGGMAELYLADYLREDGFRRRVAVKRILPHFAADADFVQMFIREARLAALLQHPNIVQVFDYGRIAEVSFIAMEYIDGKNLRELFSAIPGGMPVAPAAFIFAEACKGLEYSHAKADDQTGAALHIVHRDISPQNVLVSFQGEVKISDFGISKARSEPSLTQAGVLKGKLMYLAPEQLSGSAVDHRLDLYALGLVFYEALTGQPAYRFASEVEAIRGIPAAVVTPPAERNPAVPAELSRIVMKCLEKQVEARYGSAGEVFADLAAFRRAPGQGFDASDLAAFMNERFGRNK